MTPARNSSPTRAVVLGGGGAVGVGWQTGLLTGLREAGVDLAGAEAIVGTSAGALVGALLSSGRDVTDALTALSSLGKSIDSDSLAAGDKAFLSARRQASLDPDPQQALRAIGRAAQQTSTIAEDVYLGLFSVLDGIAWPAAFRCTVIDIDTGDLVVWDEGSGVPLRYAVAASCSIPMLFPTVAVNGRHYFDGGMLSHLNAAAAPPTDALVVLSCHPLGAPSTGDDSAPPAAAEAELAQLRETTRLVAIEPDFGDLKAAADLMMDPNFAIQAFQIGRRQAEHEAAAIQAVWLNA